MKYTITTVLFVALLSVLQAQIEIQRVGNCFCEGEAQQSFMVMAEMLPRKTEPAVREWNKDLDGIKHHSEVDLDGINSDAFYKLDINATEKVDEFLLDLQKEGDDFLDEFVGDPDLMEAWDKLPQNLRTNVGWLTRTSVSLR